MPYDWEGNRRSGVALAMRYVLKLFIHLRAQALKKGDKHSAKRYTPLWGMALSVYLLHQIETDNTLEPDRKSLVNYTYRVTVT